MDSSDLNHGKLVVITGANRGLGKALIDVLGKSKKPYNIIATARDPEKCVDVQEALSNQYPNIQLQF